MTIRSGSRPGPSPSVTYNPTLKLRLDATDVDGNPVAEQYMFLHYGIGPGSGNSTVKLGSYWEFDVYNVKNPAGVYNISFKMCSSGGGAKFFRLEYALDDSPWIPIDAVNSADYVYGGSSHPVEYTYATPSSNKAVQVNNSFHLDDFDSYTTLRIRTVVVARTNCNNDGNTGVNTTATNRVFGTPTISFTAD